MQVEFGTKSLGVLHVALVDIPREWNDSYTVLKYKQNYIPYGATNY